MQLVCMNYTLFVKPIYVLLKYIYIYEVFLSNVVDIVFVSTVSRLSLSFKCIKIKSLFQKYFRALYRVNFRSAQQEMLNKECIQTAYNK